MKKFIVIFLTLSLILLTAFVKNSTKRIDDEIFVIEENIRILKKDFENVKLEYDYLSSAEKLHKFYNLYFEDKLFKKDIQEMKIINKNLNKIKVDKLKLTNE